MSVPLPKHFVDSRLGRDYGILLDLAGDGTPMTREEVMTFARSAYAQGYFDQLHGVIPQPKSKPKRKPAA